MKKIIIYLAISIVVLIAASCEKESVLRLEEYGYVKSKASILENLSGKSLVPLCSDELPTKIFYLFRNEKGLTFMEESSITNTYNSVWLNEEIRLPVGRYTVEDISLMSDAGNVTHRVPNRDIPGFNFSSYVETSTPFDVVIFSEEETPIESWFLCYTSEILNTSGTLGSFNEILPLQTLYFRIPEGGCMDRFTALVYPNKEQQDQGKEIVNIDISGRGIRGVPILRDFEFMDLTAWSGNEKISTVTITEYNQKPEEDGSIELNLKDVVEFGNCN